MKRVHAALIAAAAASVAAFAYALELGPAEAPPEKTQADPGRDPERRTDLKDADPNGRQDPDNANPDPEAPPAPAADRPRVPPQISESVNSFAFDFYRKLPEYYDGNIFFSPANIHVIFGIIYEGARGETAEQMRGVFGFEREDADRRAASARMMAALNAQDPHAISGMASAVWMTDWSVPYLDAVREAYLAAIQTHRIGGSELDIVEYQERLREKIGDWASKTTHGENPMALSTMEVYGPQYVGILLSAAYFNGTWLVQFPEENTREGRFWTGGANTVDAHFMHAEGSFDYADAQDAQVLRMPYEGGRLSMLAVLPHATVGIEKLGSEMSAVKMSEYLGMLEARNISVSLPKFDTHDGYTLNHILEAGMMDVFRSPDLSGISQDDLHISWTHQNTNVRVNENGTAVSAAHAAERATTGSAPLPPSHFKADRPFLFIIYDEQSELILFMGRLSDPRPLFQQMFDDG